MIRRLRDRREIDRLPEDRRRSRSRVGRWLYLGVLIAFFLWLTDTVVGPLLRLQADGVVAAEHVTIGVPFAAQVEEVAVTPGAEVGRGETLARVVSVELSQGIATLTARNAELVARRIDIERRTRIASAVLPIARDRAAEADRAVSRIREVRDAGNVSLVTWSQALADRFSANERVAELQAELQAAEAGLVAVGAALSDAARALALLDRTYADGTVRAPENGMIGLTTARPGDVLTTGEPLMILYRPQRFVLAYLETGTLYSVGPGDEVWISDGFTRTTGRVSEVLPVADQLPEEFRRVFQPRGRSQVARIALDRETVFPLFAKVAVTGIGWLSPNSFLRVRLERLLR